MPCAIIEPPSTPRFREMSEPELKAYYKCSRRSCRSELVSYRSGVGDAAKVWQSSVASPMTLMASLTVWSQAMDRTRMRSRRRVLALVTGASCWLLPGIAHAEVDDKIPGTISLLFATMVVAAVTGFVVWAMKGSHILRLALLALLIVIASALIFELRFSDISEAVSTEMGRPYIAFVWMLVVLPLSGAIGIVLQGRHREDGSGSRSRSGGSVRPTTR